RGSEQLPTSETIVTDVGPMMFPSEDAVMRPFIARTGDWDIDEAQLFRSFLRRGMTVVDVGAHVGYYTILASRAVGWTGHVIALEPHPVNATLLRANVAQNKRRNVRVLEIAAWSEPANLHMQEGVVGAGNTGDHRIVRGVGNE